MASIRTKRAYERPHEDDGVRILVDRLWPRGVHKAAARFEYWAKAIAPSHELRKWYGHDPAKWPEFKRRYYAELATKPDELATLMDYVAAGPVTFVYSSKERELNNATALKEYVEAELGRT